MIYTIFLYVMGAYATWVVFRFPDMPPPPFRWVIPSCVAGWPVFWMMMMAMDVYEYTMDAWSEWRLSSVRAFFNDREMRE